MNDLDPEVILILGLVLPPVIAVIVKAGWDSTVKSLVAVALAVACGLFAAWYSDAFDKDGILTSIAATYVWMQVTYHGLFKPTGATDAIEKGVLA